MACFSLWNVKESSERATQRIFTARAASRAIIAKEINDWTIMPSFARRDRTAVSVGEKAVLVSEKQIVHEMRRP
jgi:hypothetical protein